MFINFKNTIKNNIPTNLVQPRRSQIYVGYQCHQNCGFCYYKQHLHEKMFDVDYVLKQIDLEIAYGITDFEITGGEPSECKNLTYYCKYIKEKLPTARIAIITNGGLFAINDVWNYIDEVLVSYHISKNTKNINSLIFPNGHTYDKVKKTINIARSKNKFIRTNTVIGTFNIDELENIVNDLIELKPEIINFLPVNLFDDAKNMDQFIDYSKLRPILKTQIDKIKNNLPNTLIFVRYMPFCDMEGYEQHIVGTLQHIYDWFDWNPELCGQYLLDYINKYPTIDEILNYLGKFGSMTLDRSFDCIIAHYEKSKKCYNCKYYVICDGVEKTKNNILFDHIINMPGKMIKNPMEFIKDTTYRKYLEIYG